jgi:hypothetical protein
VRIDHAGPDEPVAVGSPSELPMPRRPILAMPLDRFDRLGDPSIVDQQPVGESFPNIASDPAAAIGSSKDLVESVSAPELNEVSLITMSRRDMNALAPWRKVE